MVGPTIRSVATAIGLMAAALVPAHAQTPVKFSLDWSFSGYHAGFVQAADQGDWQRQGLAVTIDRGFGVTDTISKVAAGTYDIGFADVNALVKFNADHPENRVLAVFQIYDKTMAAIMALKKTGIRTPADLRGKTIAAAEADVGRLLFPAFAAANHLDPDSVKFAIYAPNLRDGMVVQGRADAVTGYTITSIFNIMLAGVAQDDIVTLPYSELGVDVYGSSLIVTEAFAASHGPLITSFIRGTIAGLNSAVTDPQAGIAAVAKRDALMDPKIEAGRLKMVTETAFLTPFIVAHGWGEIDPARMARTIEVNAAAYGIANPPTPAQLYTTKFLPPAAERQVARP